jgi:CRISPR-associated endonuclease Csy4
MKCFIEITLLTDPEISPYFLWSKLYTQLHLAFVEHKDANEKVPYGVSFPQYRVGQKGDVAFVTLGSKLRIFAETNEQLKALNLSSWLERLLDYVHVSSIKPMPTDKPISYLTVARDRAKPFSPARNAAYAARRGMSEVAAQQHFMQNSRLKPLPFITLNSLTNGQTFALKIDQKPADEACSGVFSSYGLSATSTVPHWES